MRKEPKLENINLNDSLSEINIPKIDQLNKSSFEIDFASCEPERSFKIDLGLGSVQLKVTGPENNDTCLVETLYEMEGGYYVNECRIPFSLGTMEFTSDNFESISRYCKIKSTGSGLLELNQNQDNR